MKLVSNARRIYIAEMLWNISRIYSRLYGVVKDATGINLRGLGFILRRLDSDRVFDACGRRWFFDRRIPSTYMRLVGGSFNEPETQRFLRNIAERSPAPVTFIDVGTNIGEMIVEMASHPNVASVTGFEPHPVCNEVCRKNLELNGLTADIRQAVMGDGTAQAYVVDPRYAPTSGIRDDQPETARTPTKTLDNELSSVSGPCILLIDVEGAELAVMKGGAGFIHASQPLIVFEYNDDNRRKYSLEDVRRVVGDGYEIFRLRSDGRIDNHLAHTWNCVAVPAQSVFRKAIGELMVNHRM
jgi:FkbM family methyltransferase